MKSLALFLALILSATTVLGTNVFWDWLDDPLLLSGDFYTLIDGEGPTPPSGLTPVLEWLTGSDTVATNSGTGGASFDGTGANTTYTAPTNGVKVGVWDFNGSSSKITAGDLGETNDWSVSLWGNLDEETLSTHTLTSLTDDGAYSSLLAAGGIHPTFDNYYAQSYVSGGSQRVDSSFAYSQFVGQWHFFTITKSSTTYTIYMDGLYVNSGTMADIDINAFVLGVRNSDGNYWWNGSQALIKVYDVVMTPAEVKEQYTEEGATLGIIPDYLADNTNTYWNDVALDLEFNNNVDQDGSTSNFTTKTSSSPAIKGTTAEGWADFNGGANHVELEDAFFGNILTDWTISFWMYPRSDGGGNFSRILDNKSGNGFFLTAQGDNGSFLTLDLDYQAPGGDLTTGQTIPLNAWTFVTVEVDGSVGGNSARIYTNGVLDVATTNFTVNAGGDLYIGNNSAGSRGFDGLLDEVIYYKRILTDQEKIDIYDSGATTHP